MALLALAGMLPHSLALLLALVAMAPLPPPLSLWGMAHLPPPPAQASTNPLPPPLSQLPGRKFSGLSTYPQTREKCTWCAFFSKAIFLF